MNQRLNNIQEAFTISNEAQPLSVVCVLHLRNGPTPERLRISLERLQERHTILQSKIIKKGRNYCFEPLEPRLTLPLEIYPRPGNDTWKKQAENALNTKYDISGPLLKCALLVEPSSPQCELIVCFHHSIIDGISARLYLHEILSLLGGQDLPELPPKRPLPTIPAAYRSGSFYQRLFRFSLRQLNDEIRYRQKGIRLKIPQSSQNAIISFHLSPQLSRTLSLRIGRKGLSLNTVLSAAILQAVWEFHVPERDRSLARIINFASLRSSLSPPVLSNEAGSYISMIRLTVPKHEQEDIWQLSHQIKKAIFAASRKGEIFLMYRMSKHLIRLSFALGTSRLGLTALSFIGKLDLQEKYGDVQLENVNAYVTNNLYGPSFSAFGKILFGSIGLDFCYLTDEMSAKKANSIVKRVVSILEEIAE